MRIDLHTHSSASDGTQAPADVVRDAAAAGLDVLALTDHDTAAGWDEAAVAAQRYGIDLVRGTEISCVRGGVSIHLLSYLHDPDHAGLRAELERSRTSRLVRARRMVDLLAVDYDLDWAAVQAQVRGDATIGRPHIADALVAGGIVTDRNEAFATMLGTRSPYFVGHYAPDAVDAVRLVRAAGGVPVFAHPAASRRGRTVGDDVIGELVDAGLAGLEVEHRDHDDDQRARLRVIAAHHGLLTTGSSDYHGAGKPNLIGENLTGVDAYEAIVAQGTGREVLTA